jgi:hypothetical protein
MLPSSLLWLGLLPHLNKRNARLPTHTSTGTRHLIIQLIDLFQSQPFGLVDHKVHEANADKAAPEPDEEDLRLQVRVAVTVVDKVRGCEAQRPVHQPVCGGRHGERLCAGFKREDLAGDNPIFLRKFISNQKGKQGKYRKQRKDVPGDWAPRGSEEEDKDANKRNGRLLGRSIVDDDSPLTILARCSSPHNGNNQLRDSHPNRTEEQDRAPPPFVNRVESRNRRSHVDAVDN